ncbi:MAG: peptidoglycan recognition family protein [Lachnospiraceae bacterium]
MPTDTKDERNVRRSRTGAQRPAASAGQRAGTSAGQRKNSPRRMTKKERQRLHRKRVIQVWIRRIVVILILILLIILIVLGVRKLFSKSEKVSAYGLPDYVTEEYLDVNKYSRPKVPLLSVNSIVIHYTANPGTDAEANRNYFNNLANQDGVENPTYASSNFVIGIDGEIIAAVPIDEVAYASNQLNETSLSIENCHPDETGQFTDATYQSLIKLTAWLCHHYGLTSENVIRHYDVTGKACPLYYVEHEDAWTQLKADVQTEINRLNAENVASGDAAASVSETNSTIASEADNGSTAESGSEDVSGTDAENTGASKAESVSNENADSESVSAELQSQQSGAE